MEGIIVVTYRRNVKCNMCTAWKYPSKKEEKVTPKDIEKLPNMRFINITGGEPFVRDDHDEIITGLKPKIKCTELLGERGCNILQEGRRVILIVG